MQHKNRQNLSQKPRRRRLTRSPAPVGVTVRHHDHNLSSYHLSAETTPLTHCTCVCSLCCSSKSRLMLRRASSRILESCSVCLSADRLFSHIGASSSAETTSPRWARFLSQRPVSDERASENHAYISKQRENLEMTLPNHVSLLSGIPYGTTVEVGIEDAGMQSTLPLFFAHTPLSLHIKARILPTHGAYDILSRRMFWTGWTITAWSSTRRLYISFT